MRLTVLGVIGVLALGIGVAHAAPVATAVVPPTATPKKDGAKICTDSAPATKYAVLSAWATAANKAGLPSDVSVIHPGAVSAGVKGGSLTTMSDTCQGNTLVEWACQGDRPVSQPVNCAAFGPGATCQKAASGRGFCALPDTDGDTIVDFFDNCPKLSNVTQLNTDKKGRGDACTLQSLSFASQHACAVSAIGEVWCWGLNDVGQIGNGMVDDGGLVPQKVLGLANVTQVVTGHHHTCALKSDGSVLCWGENGYGQLGDGSTEPHLTPMVIKDLTNVTQLTAGLWHTCAVTNIEVACWGLNDGGQLGDGTMENRSVPTLVPEVRNVQHIDASGNQTCAVDDKGHVVCWGYVANGTSSTLHPVPVADVPASVRVGVGDHSACAIDTEARIWCWGSNSHGQLGDGTFDSHTQPTMIVDLAGISHVSFGSTNDVCAVTSGGQLSCWGATYMGEEEGQPLIEPISSPQPIAGLAGVTTVSLGGNRTCALDSQGQAWCWGIGNGLGELGNGTTSPSATPVPVAF